MSRRLRLRLRLQAKCTGSGGSGSGSGCFVHPKRYLSTFRKMAAVGYTVIWYWYKQSYFLTDELWTEHCNGWVWVSAVVYWGNGSNLAHELNRFWELLPVEGRGSESRSLTHKSSAPRQARKILWGWFGTVGKPFVCSFYDPGTIVSMSNEVKWGQFCHTYITTSHELINPEYLRKPYNSKTA